MREPVDWGWYRELEYDEETGWVMTGSTVVGFFVGWLAVGALGFVSSDLHLPVVGGTWMAFGFGLLAWAFRLKGKRKRKRS